MFFCFAWLSVLVMSCGESGSTNDKAHKATRNELKTAINEMEDSLKLMNMQKAVGATFTLSQQELINRLTNYYRNYPEDPFSAECLFKVQMAYSALNAHKKSIAYGDTLLTKFPSYKNKYLAIESNIAALDVFIEPRDTAQIRKYYNMLLKDSNYPSNKKKEITRRLAFLHLTIFEYAALPQKDKTKK